MFFLFSFVFSSTLVSTSKIAYTISNLNTCMVTRTEIGFIDRPQDIQNLKQPILPIIKYRILDLVLV